MTIDYEQLARKHGFSRVAVETIAQALVRGNRIQAQFNHPELGGMGQWQPGMIMIGDAFNHALKARVDALCHELARLDISQAQTPAVIRMPQESAWWPQHLSTPTMVGVQNEARYAYFQAQQRLVIQVDEQTHIYDVGGHRLTGSAQAQQNGWRSLAFHTEAGKTLTVADFKHVDR